MGYVFTTLTHSSPRNAKSIVSQNEKKFLIPNSNDLCFSTFQNDILFMKDIHISIYINKTDHDVIDVENNHNGEDDDFPYHYY